ncbi:MAG TPA: dienelactone hydrolase family protein [Myxococcota bacterium]|jgi:dienelactone hydrolase|nr:dienelactone hydrolase family protein [Myxococcota bacterium]
MSYDPFARGPHPVGVRSFEPTDAARGRTLPLEVWYPAAEAHRGADLSPETQDTYQVLALFPGAPQAAVRDAEPAPLPRGRAPVVVFSHGFGGHRRQTTFLCTHLASHGYVVAAPDHVGNTVADMMQTFMDVQAGKPLPDPDALLGSMIAARPADASFVLDWLLGGGAAGVSELADAARVGISGHSFGGWTTLVTASRDPRVRAALPLAPAGGASPLPANPLRESVETSWQRELPCLYLVADRDTLLPLEGMRELYGRTPAPKRMAVLRRSDHMHFCDRVEQTHEMFRMLPKVDRFAGTPDIPPISELVPGEHAYAFVRGLGLAHFDAALREHEAAAKLLSGDLVGLLAERGVAIDVL